MWLPQAVYKMVVNSLSQKVIYASMTIDPVISVCSPNEDRIHLAYFIHKVTTFGKRCFCLVFSNTSHVGILYRFGKVFIKNS